MSKELRIDPEFQALLPVLSDGERSSLERSILADGCRESLIVWNGTLVDGHNRYTICRKHGLDFGVREKEFADRDAVMDWMDSNQLGRRNLTRDAYRLALGRLYNRRKRTHGGDRKSSCNNCNLNESTSEAIAREYGVSSRTVCSAGKFAEEVEQDEELLQAINHGLSVKEVLKERGLPHVSNNSGNNEWYTPSDIVECARCVMGGIDLDPASSEIANRVVRADAFFSEDDDGLSRDWHGRVWLNPPYAQPWITQFCRKLADEWNRGHVKEACVLVNNATETAWFRILVEVASAVWFPAGRIRYLDESGEPVNSPLQGQCVLYVGENPESFFAQFPTLGGWICNVVKAKQIEGEHDC